MVVPGPPAVRGPVLSCSPSVRVDGVLAGATVVVSGTDGTPYAKKRAKHNGTAWLPVKTPLPTRVLLVATQELDGEESEPSSYALRVEAPPDILPKLAFEVLLNPCSDKVLLSGLVPGAEVLIRHGSSVTSAGTAVKPVDWFPVPHLAEGEQIYAQQRLLGRQDSDEVGSDPVGHLPGNGRPGTPEVLPLTACQSEITFTGVTPTAKIRAEFDDGSSSSWHASAPAFTGRTSHRVPEGSVRVQQTMPGCEFTSEETKAPIGPEQMPPKPEIPHEFCPEVRKVCVNGLVTGATVEFAVSSGGTETPLRVYGTHGGSQEFDLPPGVGGTGPRVSLVVRQKLCTLVSDPGTADEVARDGEPSRPHAYDPFACQQEIYVRGGSGVGVVYSEKLERDISDPFIPGETLPASVGQPSDPIRVRLHYPAIANDNLTVRFTGCNAPEPVTAKVLSLGSSIAENPKVVPPLPGDTHLLVWNVWPGATAVARVNNTIRAIAKGNPLSPDWSCLVPLGEPLKEGDRYWVYMRLCGLTSNRDGALTVERGVLDVQSDTASLTVGKTSSVVVTALNASTGAPVPALSVFLDGTKVGATGKAFSFLPSAPGVIHGTVAGGARFTDGTFTMTVKRPAPPPPSPGPTYQLRLTGYVQDGYANVVVKEWTLLLRPSWSSSTITAAVQGLTGSVQLSPIPAGTSNLRVDIELAWDGYEAQYLHAVTKSWMPLYGRLSMNPTLASAEQNWDLVFYQGPPQDEPILDAYGKPIYNEYGILATRAVAQLVLYEFT